VTGPFKIGVFSSSALTWLVEDTVNL